MNVYDLSHQLANAIKGSEEYKQFNSAREAVEANPDLDAAIKDFTKKQFELQAAQMMGQEIPQEAMAQMAQLSGVLMSDPAAANYLQCQMRFSIMMSDVYKIIGEVADMNLGIGPDGE